MIGIRSVKTPTLPVKAQPLDDMPAPATEVPNNAIIDSAPCLPDLQQVRHQARVNGALFMLLFDRVDRDDLSYSFEVKILPGTITGGDEVLTAQTRGMITIWHGFLESAPCLAQLLDEKVRHEQCLLTPAHQPRAPRPPASARRLPRVG
jgi:hypothetical protein